MVTHRQNLEVKNADVKKNVIGHNVKWDKKSTEKKSNIINAEWGIISNGKIMMNRNKVEDNKRQMRHNVAWEKRRTYIRSKVMNPEWEITSNGK